MAAGGVSGARHGLCDRTSVGTARPPWSVCREAARAGTGAAGLDLVQTPAGPGSGGAQHSSEEGDSPGRPGRLSPTWLLPTVLPGRGPRHCLMLSGCSVHAPGSSQAFAGIG